MREILFRAKAKNRNRWVYGDLIHCENSYSIIEKNGGCVKVKPETVGQYTELKDKNGTKIFEGDIVKDIDNGFYKVVYYTKCMRFSFEQAYIEWGLDAFDSIKDFEIIGNVYDNPKLIGEKK